MIDTHAHLNTERFEDDIDEVIARAKSEGVENVIIPAIEPKDYDNLISLVDKYDELYFGIGVHPHSADKFDDEVLERIKEISTHPKCVAIGEIGLDYHYDDLPDKEIQHNAFRKQLQAAKELDKPVIIHNRDSDDDLVEILTQEQDGSLKGVMHCFPDDIDLLKKSLNLSLYVSFTGNITFKKSKHDKVLKEVPLDRFLIETDSPYMAPVPYRGKRNESAFVKEVAKKIAEAKEMKFDDIIKFTTENAIRLFKLSLFLLSFIMMSQMAITQEYDDEYYDNESKNGEYLEHPFPKFIGFGGLIGTNTIVESQDFPQEGVSDPTITYEGLASFGGSINYGGLLDYMILQVSYAYSENPNVIDTPNVVFPNVHQILELTTMWIPNPYNRVNVFGAVGPSIIFNSINNENVAIFGLNAGIGFLANYKIENVGLINAVLEWRLNFEFGSQDGIRPIPQGNTNAGEARDIQYSNFYSIPRFSLVFYPEF